MNQVCWVCGGDGEVVVVVEEMRWWRCRACGWNWLERVEGRPEDDVTWLDTARTTSRMAAADYSRRN